MAQENVNNAGLDKGQAIHIANSQVTSAAAAEKVANDQPSFQPDFSSPQKGPGIPSDIGSHVIPFNESSLQDQEQAVQAKFANLDLRFGDEDLDDSIASSFALAENDQMSALVDRNPMAESHRIVDASLLDLEEALDIDFDSEVD